MKVLVILVDGAGEIRCAYVRNPSLFRREIVVATGEAHIVYLGAAVAAISTDELILGLETNVLPHFAATAGLRDNPFFQARVEWERLRLPLARAICRRARDFLGITLFRKIWSSKSVEGARHG